MEFKGNRPTSPRRDEMAAFANASGGKLLCEVADDGRVQGMSPEQMAAVDGLLVELSTDAVKPALRIDVHHRELDGKAFVLVEVPRGDTIHERDGRTFVRDCYFIQRYLFQANGDIVPVDAEGVKPKSRRWPQPTVALLKQVESLRPARDEFIIATGIKLRHYSVQLWGWRAMEIFVERLPLRAATRRPPTLGRRPP